MKKFALVPILLIILALVSRCSDTFNAAFQAQTGNRNYKVLDWGHQLGLY